MEALILKDKVVDVVFKSFPVAAPLIWESCHDDVAAGWQFDGSNFIAPFSIIKTTEQIQAELFKQYDIAIELYLDEKAKEAGYYDPLDRIPAIDRACAYAGFENEYQAESQIFVRKRSQVWAYVYGELAKAQAGEREMPSIDDIKLGLDVNVWNV